MATTTLQLGGGRLLVRPGSKPAQGIDGVSFLLAVLLCCGVIVAALATAPELCHWFLLPLLVCGVLIGTDLVDWFRGRVDLFDARGTLGLLGFHFFFLAPLLMIAWNYRMHYLPEQPDDYRDWLGLMAMLNAAGLLVYRLVLGAQNRGGRAAKAKAIVIHRWTMRGRRFWTVWTLLVTLSIAAEAWMLVQFGGISGYMAAYSSWLAGGGDSFEGAALLFAVSESLPILLIIGFAFWAHQRKPRLFVIIAVFSVFVVLNFCIGGLRGSRSNVIWTTFWAAGIVHLYVRRIPRVAAIGAIVVLYAFVSFYAAYKQHGAHLLDDYSDSGDASTLNKGAEDLPTVLVGDFSRTDVQANLLWRIEQGAPLELAWGNSYLGATTMLIPKSLWPERPPTLVRWSTDAEYGNGAYLSGMMRSTRVYGIAGEAMMNFGLAGVPLAFLLLALAVRRVQRFTRSLEPSDVRLMLVPFLVNLLFLLLLDDSDNVVFYLVKYSLMPVLLLSLSSSRVTRRLLPCKLLPRHPALAIR